MKYIRGSNLVFLGVLLGVLAALPTSVLAADYSITINSSASDGQTYYASAANYSIAYNSSTASVSAGSWCLDLGQQYSGGVYGIHRPFFYFDTSGIPSDATITSAILGLYGEADWSSTDFYITIQNGMPTYPHDPFVDGDYNRLHYSGNGGWTYTNAFTLAGYNTIDLNAEGKSWINKGGWTKFCVRSDREIAGTVPTTNEQVSIWTNEGDADKIPYLYVEYTTEDPTLGIPSPIQNLVKGGLTVVWIGIVILLVLSLASLEIPLLVIVIFGGIMTIVGTTGIQMLVNSVSNW